MKLKKIKLIIFIIILIIIISYIKKEIIYLKTNIIYDYDTIYLTIDEQFNIETTKDIELKIEDSEIAYINKNILTGKTIGETYLILSKNNKTKKVNVIVTDLYTLPILNNNKKILKCKQYTSDEAKLLDNILEFKIKTKGYKTRAGVLEASRFLVLNFKYKIQYFYENGRLNNYGEKNYVDGEGRYYHKGLYLSEDKYDSIIASLYGPAMWGCPLMVKLFQREENNGLDCSGYISWAMLNAGFDIGDSGSGINKDRDDDLDDFGEKMRITSDSFIEEKIKPGDLISRDAHIGIIIGIENNKYYVAEALDYDLHINTYTKKELIESDWAYIQLMDSYYKEDGNLTSMGLVN